MTYASSLPSLAACVRVSVLVTNGPVCCLVTAAATLASPGGAKVRGNHLPPRGGHTHHSPHPVTDLTGFTGDLMPSFAGLSIIWRGGAWCHACGQSWWCADYLIQCQRGDGHAAAASAAARVKSLLSSQMSSSSLHTEPHQTQTSLCIYDTVLLWICGPVPGWC